MDEAIEFYKRGIDREALRENLRLTPAERLEKFARMMEERGQGGSASVDARHASVEPEMPSPTSASRAIALLEDLIVRKRAAGRPEDFRLMIALEAIRKAFGREK